MNYEAKYFELNDKISRHKGENYSVGLNVYDLNLKVFIRSTKDAMRLISRFSNLEYTKNLFDIQSTEKMNAAVVDSISVFMGFLFAYKTFADCNQISLQKYFSEDAKEYSTRVESTFKGRNQFTFCRNLRDYTAHYGLPILRPRASYAHNSMSTDILLNGTELLNSGFKWVAGRKDFLTANREIHVMNLITLVRSETIHFNQEFIEYLDLKYGAIIQEWNGLKRMRLRVIGKT